MDWLDEMDTQRLVWETNDDFVIFARALFVTYVNLPGMDGWMNECNRCLGGDGLSFFCYLGSARDGVGK